MTVSAPRSPTRHAARDFGVDRLARSRWVLLFAGWTIFGIAQALLRNVLTLPQLEGALYRLAVMYLPVAWLWALLTPVIGWWDRRVEGSFSSSLGRVAGHIPLFLVTALVSAALRRSMTGATTPIPIILNVLFAADLHVSSYLVAVWASRAMTAMEISAHRERRRLALQEQLVRAQVEYLELQLRPHFLFNALGAITSLAHEAPRNAARMLRSLARLLESAVSRQGKGLVSLEDELQALEHYLAIQRARFADWLTIEQTVDGGAQRALVPQFVLQPLVENAVHHGLLQRSASGRIAIRASVQDDRLRVTVSDNGVGLQKESYQEGRGIGLENLRSRLRGVYGDDASLTLGDEPGGGTVARLDVPMRSASAESQAPLLEPSMSITAESPILEEPVVPEKTTVSPVTLLVIGVLLAAMRIQRGLAYVAIGIIVRDPMASPPITDDLLVAALWVPLAAVIWILSRRYPLERSRLLGHTALHVAAAFTLVLLHVWLTHLLGRSFTFPVWSLPSAELWSWDVSVYGILLAAAHYRQVQAWLHTRDVAADRLRRELQEARFDNVMLELRPTVLLDALRQVESSLLTDPSPRQAERALAEIAAFLRHTLDSMRHRAVSLRMESEAVCAYAKLLVASRSVAGLDLRVEVPDALANQAVPNGLLRAVLDSTLGEPPAAAGRASVAVRVREQGGGGGPTIAAVAEGSLTGRTVTPSRQLLEYLNQGLIALSPNGAGGGLRIHVLRSESVPA